LFHDLIFMFVVYEFDLIVTVWFLFIVLVLVIFFNDSRVFTFKLYLFVYVICLSGTMMSFHDSGLSAFVFIMVLV